MVPAGTTVSVTLGASARQMVDLSRVTRTESANAETAEDIPSRMTRTASATGREIERVIGIRATADALAAGKHSLSDFCDHGEIRIDHVGNLVFEGLAHQ